MIANMLYPSENAVMRKPPSAAVRSTCFANGRSSKDPGDPPTE